MYTGKNNVTDYLLVPTLTHKPFRCNLELLLKDLTAQKKHVKKHGLKVYGKENKFQFKGMLIIVLLLSYLSVFSLPPVIIFWRISATIFSKNNKQMRIFCYIEVLHVSHVAWQEQ